MEYRTLGASRDAASDPQAAPYPYGPVGPAQRARRANGPRQFVRAHSSNNLVQGP